MYGKELRNASISLNCNKHCLNHKKRCKAEPHLLRKQRNKRKMARTTKPCESNRLWGLYLVAPCGNDNDHLGSKRTTIHLNPALPRKTHNPCHTHDPPRDRQQEKKEKRILSRRGIRQNKTHVSRLSLDSA